MVSNNLNSQRIVIIGAGPTGLGAANRLQELGHENWHLHEMSDRPGGLAKSFVDDAGFTWDIGGHVQFSHYAYFDDLMDRLLKDEWVYHDREAWAWMFDRFVPYPVQNNIRHFPTDALVECLRGMIEAGKSKQTEIRSFGEWMRASFGEGFCRYFMEPYNFKVWAYAPDEMSAVWVGDRVASPDVAHIVENVLRERDDIAWGPNNRFRFPLRGGTGEIWNRLANSLPQDRITYSNKVTAIDTTERRLTFASGQSEQYDILLSTMPIDELARATGRKSLMEQAGRMRYSSSNIVGIGIRGPVPDRLRTKCWMYFPESNSPFYRVTVFSNYSANNVPAPGEMWSLMAEVSESDRKPVNGDELVDDVVAGMLNTKLISPDHEIVSRWHYRAPHGYPTPFLNRTAVVDPVRAELEKDTVFSRGRFGAWKYEVSNQDHSLMQGVEFVNRLFFGTPEVTLNHPTIVNGR